MPREIQEVADILYVILNDNIKYFDVPVTRISNSTLNMIADRNQLTLKQLDFIKYRLSEYDSVLLPSKEYITLMTSEYYRKLKKRSNNVKSKQPR